MRVRDPAAFIARPLAAQASRLVGLRRVAARQNDLVELATGKTLLPLRRETELVSLRSVADRVEVFSFKREMEDFLHFVDFRNRQPPVNENF